MTIQLPASSTIDRVVIREDQSKGQRIRSFVVEVQVSGSWVSFLNGTGVGNKYIGVAPKPVSNAAAIRLRVTAASAEPQLLQFGAFSPCPVA